METKHTPGPWELIDKTVYALEHDGWRKGQEVMRNRFSAFVQGSKAISEEELVANARLMTSAPDLLGALQDLLAMCERQEDFNDDGDGKQFERCYAAIAKATKG